MGGTLRDFVVIADNWVEEPTLAQAGQRIQGAQSDIYRPASVVFRLNRPGFFASGNPPAAALHLVFGKPCLRVESGVVFHFTILCNREPVESSHFSSSSSAYTCSIDIAYPLWASLHFFAHTWSAYFLPSSPNRPYPCPHWLPDGHPISCWDPLATNLYCKRRCHK